MNDLNIEMEEKVKKSHHGIWAEKYRPETLDDLIGSAHVKEFLKACIAKKEIPHLFLYGTPGCGKTTIAQILTDTIKCDSLKINASDENSVDTIRNKVQDFAMTMGFNPFKIIVLDECLDENTLVWVLRDGIKQTIPIKDLDDTNDLVESFNIDKNIIDWKPFELYDKFEQDIIEIEFENGEKVQCTSEHKWYVRDENGIPIKMKTKDIIKNKIENILTF